MKNVAFVAPLFRENTNRYVRALADLPGVRLGVISQEPPEAIPGALRDRIAAFARVANVMSGSDLAEGCRGLSQTLGPLDRLLGVLEQLQVPLAEARESVGIPGMQPRIAQNFRDKARMKEVLRNAGIPVARHRLIASEEDVWAFLKKVGFPIVLKPLAGLGAKATYRVENPQSLRDALAVLRPAPNDPIQAEEFVTGQENTCETVTIGGKAVWHSGTHYLPSPLDVLENPWKQYCVLLPREIDDPDFTSFHPINDAALKALGMETGISHMEWFRRSDGAAMVSEVGARPPGAMIMPLMSQAHAVDMVDVWCRLMVHEAFEPPKRQYAAGVAFFRAQGSGSVVRAVTGLDRAQEEVGEYVVDRTLPTIGLPPASGYEGEGWALVRAESTDAVLHALRRLVSLVRVELG